MECLLLVMICVGTRKGKGQEKLPYLLAGAEKTPGWTNDVRVPLLREIREKQKSYCIPYQDDCHGIVYVCKTRMRVPVARLLVRFSIPYRNLLHICRYYRLLCEVCAKRQVLCKRPFGGGTGLDPRCPSPFIRDFPVLTTGPFNKYRRYTPPANTATASMSSSMIL